MSSIAVIAHAGKTFDGGLPALRRALDRHGITDPFWVEVPKSSKAPKQVRRALEQGAHHFIVWGGDGTVQRCIDTLAGGEATLGIVPAGTANLLATNLGIPKHIEAAVDIALHGPARRIDVAAMNGERFAVMAGAGVDAEMIHGADGTLKKRMGRAAYIWTGAKAVRKSGFTARIRIDGAPWYDGPATCILAGNVGALFGGIEVFTNAKPDDGQIDVGVLTAGSLAQWARTVGRTVIDSAEQSPFFRVTRAHKMSVKLDRKVLYELDGGARSKVKAYTVEVEPAAITLRVPAPAHHRTEGDR